jgi:VanZ family protein
MRSLFWLAFIGCGLVIAWLSLTPAPPPVAGMFWDKALHALAYFVFAVLGTPLCRGRSQWLWLAAGVLAYSAVMEVGQYFVPGRYMSAADMLANGVGVLVGLGVGVGVGWGKSAQIWCDLTRKSG